MDKYRNYDDNEERNDEFTGQSANKTSEDYNKLEDKWYEIEGDYRNRYGDLTDEDVRVNSGRFDETLERISRRRGKSRREIRSEIENW
jgi:uncharacterized protein YjbJ (UPF0337 family)